MKHVLFIALGGAGGALARYWLQNLMRGSAIYLPLGTLTVNVLGSFLVGVVYVLVAERATLHPDWRSVMVVGFLCAFTTFSTFSLEAVVLLENGQATMAGLYVLASVGICLCAVWAAIVLTRLV
ncbi:MAG: fluoride efflux transporter CrcB [Halieaceae bacterium]|nr:fluoride efflux transporter CrcB [Halieaceae bacterium]